MLYDICGPRLYANCLMGNLSSLYFGLGTVNNLIQKIDRLHLYSGSHSNEPTYADLLYYPSYVWRHFKTPNHPINLTDGCAEYCLHDEMLMSWKVAARLHSMHEDENPVLWGLKTVCLGDIPNVSWSMPNARRADNQTGTSNRGQDDPPIGRLLLGLPNVEHVCQSVRFGPYALDYSVHFTRYSSFFYNWHPRFPDVRCLCSVDMGPVVLGATNRYYYPCLFAIENVPANQWNPEVEGARIARIVRCLSVVNVKDGHIHLPDAPPQKFDLGKTKLEFYDYIRYVDPVPGLNTEDEGRNDRACRPATSLARIQALLDECLPECWRGRVILKDREDAPPCTACGLDVMEQWEDIVTTDKSTPGWVLPCNMVHMSEEEKNASVVILDF